jgi:streptogramin lyase
VSELSPGSVLSGHRIDDVIGRGGMGVVYRAHQIALGRTVALKVIAPELLDDPHAKERFLREARSAASIEHPNVIPVLHAGEEDGITFLVMRYVDGDDVRTLVRRAGPLTPERAARIAAQAGDALDAIHAAGLVHRDVKPGNVLLGPDDHVFVTDFGLAKEALTRGGETRSGQWVGTLDFVAPEQIRGMRVDARTDVYALGGLLFYMLTGAAPFAGHEGDEAKLWAQLVESPSSPSALRPGIPPTFDAVVGRALAKDPADRYPSTGDVGRAALAAVRDEDPSQGERIVAVGAAAPTTARAAPPEPDAPTTDAPVVGDVRRRPRGRILAVAAAAGAVIAAIVVALLLAGGSDSPSSGDNRGTAGVRVGATIENVGQRPNAIAVGAGSVWVSSAALDRLTRLDARTGRNLGTGSVVGRTVVGLAATSSEVWAALARPGRIVRLDRRGQAAAAPIPLPRDPRAIDAASGAVWLSVRGGGGVPDTVVRYDAATGRRTARFEVPERARAIAAAPDGVWVAHLDTPTVAHRDGRTGRETVRVRLPQPAYDLAFGAGYAWASLRTEDIVDRITPRTGALVSIAAPQGPRQVAVAGGHALVAGFVDHTVGVIDPRSARPVGRPLPAGLNPFAIAGDDEHAWVTAVGTNTVTRLDLQG